jgi:hypothetical protein
VVWVVIACSHKITHRGKEKHIKEFGRGAWRQMNKHGFYMINIQQTFWGRRSGSRRRNRNKMIMNAGRK